MHYTLPVEKFYLKKTAFAVFFLDLEQTLAVMIGMIQEKR